MTELNKSNNRLIKHTGIEFPIICGAMYPCSNPELVAAASKFQFVVLEKWTGVD